MVLWAWKRIAYLPESSDVAFDVAGDTLVYYNLSVNKGYYCVRCMYQSVAVASKSNSYSWSDTVGKCSSTCWVPVAE